MRNVFRILACFGLLLGNVTLWSGCGGSSQENGQMVTPDEAQKAEMEKQKKATEEYYKQQQQQK